MKAWITDYLEIGDDFWELVNAQVQGRQMAKTNYGLFPVQADDRESVCRADWALMQIDGKELPCNGNLPKYIGNERAAKLYKAKMMVLGGLISAAQEIVKGGINGFKSAGPLGAVCGVVLGAVQGIIGVVQSLVAGLGVQKCYDNWWESSAKAT